MRRVAVTDRCTAEQGGGQGAPSFPRMPRHFGSSQRAAARYAAANGSGDEQEEPVERRYRYIVHVREHTLIVPMARGALVSDLTAEVDARVSRRQLAAAAVVGLQVRTEASGSGIVEATDRLDEVITEQDELQAVLEDSYPIAVPSAVPSAREVLSAERSRVADEAELARFASDKEEAAERRSRRASADRTTPLDS